MQLGFDSLERRSVCIYPGEQCTCMYLAEKSACQLQRIGMQHTRWHCHLSLLCILRAIASGSILSPPVKDPTVCPLGLGGREGSRGGPGFFFLSRSSLKAPPRMVPPFFSSAVICMHMQVASLTSTPHYRNLGCCLRVQLLLTQCH